MPDIRNPCLAELQTYASKVKICRSKAFGGYEHTENQGRKSKVQAPNVVFGNTSTLQQNLGVFSVELMKLNGSAGPLLVTALPHLMDAAHDKDDLLDRLPASITTPSASTNTKSIPPAAAPMSAHVQPEGRFLECIEIESSEASTTKISLSNPDLNLLP